MSLASRFIDAVLDFAFPQISFSDPLTLPAPDAPSVERAPVPISVAPPAEVGPAGFPRHIVIECGPDLRYGILPNHCTLMAYDCLYENVAGHVCRNNQGDPIRGGQSCFDSVRLMSQLDFPRHPLYAKAVGLGLVVKAVIA